MPIRYFPTFVSTANLQTRTLYHRAMSPLRQSSFMPAQDWRFHAAAMAPEHMIPQHMVPEHEVPLHVVPQEVPQRMVPQYDVPQRLARQYAAPQRMVPEHMMPQHMSSEIHQALANHLNQLAPTSTSIVSPGAASAGIAIYGLIIICAGVAGYVNTRSNPSLISGIIAGLILFFAYLRADIFVALAVALVLSLVFTLRTAKTKALVPAGLLCGVSVVFTIFFAIALYG